MTDNFDPTEWITTKEAAELMGCTRAGLGRETSPNGGGKRHPLEV